MFESILRKDIRELREFVQNLHQLTKEIHELMSTVPAGLAALQKAQADVLAAVQGAVQKIADLSSQLSAINSEDPAVAAIAADLETQASALNNVVNPPAPTA
jgi:ABC-type transporter Mla subunit MlaD